MTPSPSENPHPKRRSVFADKLGAYADFVSLDEAAFERRGTWRAFFRERIGPAFDGRIVLEVGCSDATTLVAMAAKHPTTGFVGLDWKYRQLHIGAERIADSAIKNTALLRARAQEIRQLFADGEVEECLLFHPEPCERPEEVANRLLTERFVLNLYPVISEAGTLSIKTDYLGYFETLNAMFANAADDVATRFDVIRISTDFWNDTAVQTATARRCFSGETTLFERRFMRKRQPIFYYELQKRP